MKKRMIITIAAALVIGAGTIYAVGTGYVQFGVPTQAEIDSSVSQAADAAAQKVAQELQVSSIAQEQALAELEAQVKQLEQEMQNPPESAASAPPKTSAASAPAASSLPTPESKSIATAMAAKTPSAAAPAKPAKVENAGTVFEGYTVTVTDKNTLAVRAAGNDWPITKYYFIADDGTYLGSISGAAMNAMIDKYMVPSTGDAPGGGGEWEYWFAEEFNAYRGLSDNNSIGSGRKQSGDNPVDADAKEVDTDDYANEVIDLINKKREDKGLHTLEVDSNLMSHSEVRAEELSIQYSHVRPDGTKEKSECIVMRRDTPSAAVQAWMDSDPHRDAILDESGRFPYQYIGSGCYQDEGGVLYWVITFGV